MATKKSQRVAELEKLRGELVKQLARLDFRSESIGPALAKMAQHAERTIGLPLRRLSGCLLRR
jgi:hypothetical protein